MDEFDVSTTFFALLTVAAQVATLGLWTLVLLARTGRAVTLHDRVRAVLGETGLVLATVVAGVATVGSLYLSERLGLVPCALCWYQRIAMYPLAVIVAVGALRRDWAVRPYALTLAVIGPLISVYHYLEERFPSLDAGVCDLTVPCSLVYVWRFHYISIPLMALSAFALVATILVVARPPVPTPEETR
jgi:hypothetical protein